MFGIGTGELLIIFFLALILLGPKRIPQIAKSLGKAAADLRRMTEDLRRDIETSDLERADFVCPPHKEERKDAQEAIKRGEP